MYVREPCTVSHPCRRGGFTVTGRYRQLCETTRSAVGCTDTVHTKHGRARHHPVQPGVAARREEGQVLWREYQRVQRVSLESSPDTVAHRGRLHRAVSAREDQLTRKTRQGVLSAQRVTGGGEISEMGLIQIKRQHKKQACPGQISSL